MLRPDRYSPLRQTMAIGATSEVREKQHRQNWPLVAACSRKQLRSVPLRGPGRRDLTAFDSG